MTEALTQSAPDAFDFFADLDAQISATLAKSKTKADAEAARKKALNTRLPSSERLAAGKLHKELSALVEAEAWRAVSTIALFHEQTCDGCGSTHRVFVQYMEHQTLVRLASSQRWIRTSRPRGDLPREIVIQPSTTHICYHCGKDHGFDPLVSTTTYLPATTAATVPSNTYFQEDINAPSA